MEISTNPLIWATRKIWARRVCWTRKTLSPSMIDLQTSSSYATMLGVGRSCGDPSLSGAKTTLPVACRIDAPRTQLPTGVAPISWTGLQLLRFHPTVALIPVKGVHHEGCIQAVSQLSFITALQPGLNHSGGDAEVVGVELGEHGPGGVDQAPLAGHGDHRRCPPTLMPNAAATARPPRSAICQES